MILHQSHVHESNLIRPYICHGPLCDICLFHNRSHSYSNTGQFRGRAMIRGTYISSAESARIQVLLWRSRSLINSRVLDLDKGHFKSLKVSRLKMFVLLDGFGVEGASTWLELMIILLVAADVLGAFLSKRSRTERISSKVLWQAEI